MTHLLQIEPDVVVVFLSAEASAERAEANKIGRFSYKLPTRASFLLRS